MKQEVQKSRTESFFRVNSGTVLQFLLGRDPRTIDSRDFGMRLGLGLALPALLSRDVRLLRPLTKQQVMLVRSWKLTADIEKEMATHGKL